MRPAPKVRYKTGRPIARKVARVDVCSQCYGRIYDRKRHICVSRWRRAVLERDGHRCIDCGSEERLTVHHIKGWNDFQESRFDVENGETLCRYCHAERHSTAQQGVGGQVSEDKEHLARHCATRCFECNDEQPAEKRGENCFCQRPDGYMCGGRYVGLCVPREPTHTPTAPPGGQEEGK